MVLAHFKNRLFERMSRCRRALSRAITNPLRCNVWSVSSAPQTYLGCCMKSVPRNLSICRHRLAVVREACTHTYTHTYTYIHTHTRTHTYIYIHTHTHTLSNTHTVDGGSRGSCCTEAIGICGDGDDGSQGWPSHGQPGVFVSQNIFM